MYGTVLPPPKSMSKQTENQSRRRAAAIDLRLAIGTLNRCRAALGERWYAAHVQPLIDEVARLEGDGNHRFAPEVSADGVSDP